MESQVLRTLPPPRPEDQRAAVQVQLSNDLISVVPGNAVASPFTVRNLGTQVEEFRCVVAGPEWLVADPATMSVYPGQEATGTVQAAPPREPGTPAGITPFRLTVTSSVHANVSGSVAGRVDVAPYFELAAELVPSSSYGRGLTRHNVALQNRGNAPLRVMLHPTDVAEGLRVGVPAWADVQPGRVTEVPVGIQGSRQWVGRPVHKTFSIMAEAPKPLTPVRLPGTRTVVPMFPAWVPVAAGLVVAAAAASGLFVPKLLGNSHPLASGSASVTVPARPASGPQQPIGQATSAQTVPGQPTSGQPTSASPTSGQASAPSSGTTTSSAPPPPPPTTPASSASSATTAPPFVPTYNLITGAPNAVWTSVSPLGQQPVTPKQGVTGCTETAGPGVGAVYSAIEVPLADNTMASTALEVDPPGHESSSISGVYNFTTPTVAGEVFSAKVELCSGAAANAQMYYTYAIGSAAATPNATVTPTQIGTINVPLPAGTTSITLYVRDGAPGTSYSNVAWVDPVVGPGNA